jgi:hypothetical protein
MPVPAQRTQVSFAAPLDSHEQCGIQRVSLGAVAPFTRAHATSLLVRGLLHATGIAPTRFQASMSVAARPHTVGFHSMADFYLGW